MIRVGYELIEDSTSDEKNLQDAILDINDAFSNVIHSCNRFSLVMLIYFMAQAE
jgi:hypothetical protein